MIRRRLVGEGGRREGEGVHLPPQEQGDWGRKGKEDSG